MGPIWVLSAPDGPHVSPIDLVILVDNNTDRLNVIWMLPSSPEYYPYDTKALKNFFSDLRLFADRDNLNQLWKFMACYYIHDKGCVIMPRCISFKDGLAKPPLKLGLDE